MYHDLDDWCCCDTCCDTYMSCLLPTFTRLVFVFLGCLQAAELSIKFLTGDRAVEVIQTVGPRLAQLRKFNAVGGNENTS